MDTPVPEPPVSNPPPGKDDEAAEQGLEETYIPDEADTRDLAELGIACPRLPDYVPRLVDFYRRHRSDVRQEPMV